MRHILDTSPIGLAILNPKTNERVFVNEKLVAMFGATSVDDLLTKNVSDSWADQDHLQQVNELVHSGKSLINFKALRLRLDGSKWWVLMNSQVTTFEGQPGLAIWHLDITDAVEAQATIEQINSNLEARVQMRTDEIRETQQRFRDYAEIASDWFWEMDAELRYTFVSDAYEKTSGKPSGNLIGRTRREMYKEQFPEERDTWLEFLDQLDAHQDFDNFRFSYRRADGGLRVMSNSGRAIFDRQNKFTGYRGIGVDITEQHLLRTQLLDQQAQLLAFTENSTSPVTIIDPDGFYILVNEIVCKNLGLRRDQILGKTVDDIFPPATAKIVTEQNQSVLADNQSKLFEFSVTYPDEAEYTFLTERFPIYASNQKLIGIGSVSTDITDRKKIEQELSVREAQFQMIVNMQNDLITRFSPDWKLTFVNRAYCEFVNAEEQNLLGSSMFDDVPQDITQNLISYFKSFTPENAIQRNENQLLRHDGLLRDLEWSNFAQFDADGKIFMYQSVGRDVTEQRQAQREIIQANEKAQEANKAKSNFLSTMSHEIRTPLNGVLGLAQLLMGSDLDRDQLSKVETILSSGQTLLAIINDVLDMSKIEAGGLELENTTFLLRDLVSVIATPFQGLADDKGLKLKVSDSFNSNLVLIGDPIRLRQILWNLLSNAIKFTDKGGVNLSISQKKPKPGAHSGFRDVTLRFVIEDTGSGITPDRLDAIFDAFTQEDNSITRKFGGTGLGLSIVRQLSDLMGGTIEAESEIGRGSRFIVTLPFHKADAEEAKKIQRSTLLEEINHSQPMKILVAEDNPVNAMIAKSFLEKFGHAVRHVENGKLAVAAAWDDWADLILMDVHMPEMDGIEATRRIRQSGFDADDLPIVGLTAEAFAERHRHFREAGMNDVLTKPFTERQLAEILNKFNRNADRQPAQTPQTEPREPPKSEAEGETDNLPIGDQANFDEFCNQLEPEMIKTLLTTVKISLSERLQELRDGVDTADPEKIVAASHAIKGSCGSMFAVRLSALASLAENQSTDMDAVRQVLSKIETASAATVIWWDNCFPE